MYNFAAQPNFEASDVATNPFRSDLRAFEILSDLGLNDTGIDLIKDQLNLLSEGYRQPERKLADILEGGVIMLDRSTLLLLHGLGSFKRGVGSGDCSETTRALAGEWARSSQSRYLAKAGLHPFYLEVAAPRLFTKTWNDGARIRAGHSVLALGSPVDFTENGSDKSFVLLDPTLGVAQPMNTSSYRQTGFMAAPEREKRPLMLPLTIQTGSEMSVAQRGSAPGLVLGIDPQAQFVYWLWFKHSADGPSAQVQAADSEGNVVVNFDAGTEELTPDLSRLADFEQAKVPLLKLIDVLRKKPLEIFSDASADNDAVTVNGQPFALFEYLRYPREEKLARYIMGLEYAAAKAEAQSAPFSLRFDEPGFSS